MLVIMTTPLLTFTDRGIYCPEGGFYIDPWRPVDRALITHGHSDHARRGHGAYLATHQALPVMRHRLGDITADGIDYAETRRIGGVTVSFHPAGHVPGSAQIRVERAGEIWVVSGDYKVENDGLSEAFVPVPCHTFITECTFGLPLFHWEPQATIAVQIADWRTSCANRGVTPILAAYGLGKAQRLMTMLEPGTTILTHGAVEETTSILRAQGYPLPPTIRVTAQTRPTDHQGCVVIAPPSALGSKWAARFGAVDEAFASGWMALRGIRRRRSLGTGFTISDHADWPGLNAAIKATGAARIFATHGYTTPFRRWLEDQGYEAGIVSTEYGQDDEGDETSQSETPPPTSAAKARRL